MIFSVITRQRISFLTLCGAMLLLVSQTSEAIEQIQLQVFAGEEMVFMVDDGAPLEEAQWTLTRDAVELAQQRGKFFRHVFTEVGPAILTQVFTSVDGVSVTRTIAVDVLPSISFEPSSGVLRAIIRSTPPATGSEHSVVLPAQGGVILLDTTESTGEIVEYHIDTNLADDSDGDQIADNDIDNRIDPSFTNGGTFALSVQSKPGETERTVRLRVKDERGDTAETTLKIIFHPDAPVTPVLQTIPPTNWSSNSLQLDPSGGVVVFDASSSAGGIISYALDLNLEEDSNGDSDPTNDNDVLGSPFSSRGTSISVAFIPSGNERERSIALMIRNVSGRTGRKELTVRFGDGSHVDPDAPLAAVRLMTEPKSPRLGEPFAIVVQDPPKGTALYAWDLQMDGTIDNETTEPRLELVPDSIGALPVSVSLFDASGKMIRTAQETVSITNDGGADDAHPTELRIDAEQEGLQVRFVPVPPEGEDYSSWFPVWDFGDGSRSYLLAPVHTFSGPSHYAVKLSFIDPSTELEVASTGISIDLSGAVTTPDQKGGGSLVKLLESLLAIVTAVLVTLAILLVISLLIVLALFFVAQKTGKEFVLLGRHIGKVREKSDEVVPSEQKNVQKDVVKASIVETEKKNDTFPPVKLVAETIKETVKPVSSEVVVATPKDDEDLPPWLKGGDLDGEGNGSVKRGVTKEKKTEEKQESQEKVLPMKSSEVAQKGAVSSETKTKSPDWLQAGLEKAEKEEKKEAPPAPKKDEVKNNSSQRNGDQRRDLRGGNSRGRRPNGDVRGNRNGNRNSNGQRQHGRPVQKPQQPQQNQTPVVPPSPQSSSTQEPLQKSQDISKPVQPPKPDSSPVVPPQPLKSEEQKVDKTQAPDWLKAGLEKSEKEEKVISTTPSSTPSPSPKPEPVQSESSEPKKEYPIPEDEPIAIIRADTAETEKREEEKARGEEQRKSDEQKSSDEAPPENPFA